MLASLRRYDMAGEEASGAPIGTVWMCYGPARPEGLGALAYISAA